MARSPKSASCSSRYKCCNKARNIQVIKNSIVIHVEYNVGVHLRMHRLIGNWVGQRQDERGDVKVGEHSIVVSVTQYDRGIIYFGVSDVVCDSFMQVRLISKNYRVLRRAVIKQSVVDLGMRDYIISDIRTTILHYSFQPLC